MLNKLPPFIRNFYFITGILFALWLIFFDSNDIITQYEMDHKLNELENEAAYYEEKITEVETERQALLTDREHLEKFARENYLMRKKNEDVFVITE